ncbi:MBOAT family O-acyltransferase [Bosea sp. (in: a-proteobacteria)]
MFFQSVEFLFLFLPVTLTAFALAIRVSLPAALSVLSLASIVFYGAHRPDYVLLLLGSAIGNYIVAGYISGRNHAIYIAAVLANIAVLAVFKYANFLISNVSAVTSLHLSFVNIVLPLAISFITFEQIAFLTDVHSGRYARGKPLEYCAFITFFPKLIAGPIIRYSEFYPQLAGLRAPTSGHVITGLCILSFALVKKLAGADSFGPMADHAYNVAASGSVPQFGDALVALFAYPLQIYFDFSAYSEMAIGIAWMIGLRLPINFDSPYRARSIVDFWRRWHITLSAFLRDYVYIPLGGNRHGDRRRYVNLMAVMLIGGLWHGAAWTFVIWGGIHGGMLVVNHLWSARTAKGGVALPAIIAWSLTMAGVLLAWIFFRAADFATAARLLRGLMPGSLGELNPKAMVLLAAGWAVCLFAPNLPRLFGFILDRDRYDWARPTRLATPSWLLVVGGAMCFSVAVIFILSGPPSTFIYFQF